MTKEERLALIQKMSDDIKSMQETVRILQEEQKRSDPNMKDFADRISRLDESLKAFDAKQVDETIVIKYRIVVPEVNPLIEATDFFEIEVLNVEELGDLTEHAEKFLEVAMEELPVWPEINLLHDEAKSIESMLDDCDITVDSVANYIMENAMKENRKTK